MDLPFMTDCRTTLRSFWIWVLSTVSMQTSRASKKIHAGAEHGGKSSGEAGKISLYNDVSKYGAFIIVRSHFTFPSRVFFQLENRKKKTTAPGIIMRVYS